VRGTFKLTRFSDNTHDMDVGEERTSELRMRAQFADAVETRSARYLHEVNEAWSDVAAILEEVRAAFRSRDTKLLDSGGLSEAATNVEHAASELIVLALDHAQERRPMWRALEATQAFHDGMLELISTLPEANGEKGSNLPSRNEALRRYRRASMRRARIEGQVHHALAMACTELREPWTIYLLEQRALRLGEKKATAHAEKSWSVWQKQTERVNCEELKAIGKLKSCLDSHRSLLEPAAPVAPVRDWSPSPAQPRLYDAALAFWWRQQRAVLGLLEMDADVLSVQARILHLTAELMDGIWHDLALMRSAIDETSAYLAGWDGTGPFNPPAPASSFRSSSELVADWAARCEAVIAERLPAQLEVTVPKSALPSVTQRWRFLEPRKVYEFVLDEVARPLVSAALQQQEERQLQAARGLERVLEVVDFGRESAARGESGAILDEALANARGLVQHLSTTNLEPDLEAEGKVLQALLDSSAETVNMIEAGRIGLLAMITGRKGRRAVQVAREIISHSLRVSGPATARWLKAAGEWLLIKVGWKMPARPPIEPVVRRANLDAVLSVGTLRRELPAIYQRLFQLAPVEDRRFLVGRDEELGGLEQAHKDWRDGQFAACLVVGARGSGKTSLLKCADKDLFAAEEVLHSEFAGRLLSSDAMDDFLARLLNVPPGTDAKTALGERRRVIILEELERTFLRKVGGFEAIRRLLYLVHATAHSTFWILALNDDAFRFLDASLNVGRIFSHRINAMSVMQSDLMNAIKQRHNLSGLRLEFAPPPPDDERFKGIRGFFRGQEDPEELFFSALYAQSGGIFRSAFELWCGSIERIEGGVVVMRQPLAPDFKDLMSEMTQQDHFVLNAIRQHGSLTAEDLSEVLLRDLEMCRVLLDRLQVMGVLEPDPNRTGFRIRPEGQHFVTEVLLRVNLF
jgi:hypothetical protein